MDPFYIALLLYLVAVALAFVDLFVPSGGMLIVLASAAALGSILFGFRSGNTMGMSMLTLVAATVPVFAYTAIRIWPHTPIGRRIILDLPEPDATETTRLDSSLQAYVGEVFLCEHALMPSGQIRDGHKPLPAVAETGMIDAGERVEVVAVKERNLIVRRTDRPLQTSVNANPATQREPQDLLDQPADELGLDSIDD